MKANLTDSVFPQVVTILKGIESSVCFLGNKGAPTYELITLKFESCNWLLSVLSENE